MDNETSSPKFVDSRNQLNDLNGKEWLVETKSFFYQKGLGANDPNAKIEKQHPAPFSFQDVMRLILFFTKKGMSVLDPFGGVGSTVKACALTGRICTSIELSEKWHNLAIQRLETEVGKDASKEHIFICSDSCLELQHLKKESFDFIITSPPYWGILHKTDQKVKKNRVNKNLDTVYSTDSADLGNIEIYDVFLNKLVQDILLPAAFLLKTGKYMVIIVSDFRHKSQYVSFHSDLIQQLQNRSLDFGGRLVLQGTKILLQNHKSMMPYGYPFSYVENIHHQYVLIFKKMK